MGEVKNNGSAEINIEEVLDLDFVQELQDEFVKALGIATLTSDVEGNKLTEPSGFTDFCQLMRTSAEGEKRCEESGRRGGKKARERGEAQVYECHAGLYDFSIPIEIAGEHVCNVKGGQIVPEDPPTTEEIRSLARELNLDPDRMVENFEDVPRVEVSQVKAAANIMQMVLSSLSEVWSHQYRLEEFSQKRTEKFNDAFDRIESISASAQELTASSQEISSQAKNTEELLEEVEESLDRTEDIYNAVKKIADKTTILGLNASIEAARLGQEGAGFNVVAEEIRELSENSKESIAEIEKTMVAMRKKMDEIHSAAGETSEITDEQASAVEGLTEDLQRVQSVMREVLEMDI